MPYSRLDDNLQFDEGNWVVSLVNTGTGLSGIFGGHAKIVVEGVKKKKDEYGLFSRELFIGEYHIMEAERAREETWMPQCLRNTSCKYLVLFSERSDYNARQIQQYQQVQSRSTGNMQPDKVMKMIDAIKQEAQNIQNGEKPDFQYAGMWCCYSYKGGHNCTTWAEEKLNIIGLGKKLLFDSSKASPSSHTSSLLNKCAIF